MKKKFKKNIRKIIYVFAFIIITACSSISDKEIIVPFTIPDIKTVQNANPNTLINLVPHVKVKVDNKKVYYHNKELICLVDTGTPHSIILKNGEKKLWGSVDAVTNIYLRSYYLKEFGHNSKISFTDFLRVCSICFRYWTLSINNQKLKHVPPVYLNATSVGSDCDMILGMDVIEANYNSITFDYRKNQIILNGDAISGPEIPMHKTQSEQYIIPIIINGMKDNAIIDTGQSTAFCVREEWEHERKEPFDDKKLKFDFNNKIVKSQKGLFYINEVVVGNITYNSVPTVLGTDSSNQFDDNYYEIIKNMNSLGFTFFYNHRIQLDFKHNVFRID